ncbi:uncharacterized protein LOC142325232 [Lycorma delicatula]|uniref:uncharacterized protein LOC142325232 n=1 Tax=Lycorma delicatula TaxID=130591 RepID=UPI003F50D702
MTIRDFDHKRISHCIKELFDIEYEGYDNGDISLLAPKVIRYQYLLLKAKTGKSYEELTPREFMERIHMSISEPPPEECRWYNSEYDKEHLKIITAKNKKKNIYC